MIWALIKIVNFNLNEMDNLRHPWQPLERAVDFASIVLCMTSFSCLSAQNFSVFLHNHLSGWEIIFTIGITTHVECFHDNYDIIGVMVWQPCWKKPKKIGPLYLWNSIKLKLETWHIASTPHGECVIFFNDVIGAFIMMS